MPEGIEIEYYRRVAEVLVGRLVRSVSLIDSTYGRGETEQGVLDPALVGNRVLGIRRRGKLLVLDIGSASLGMRFGMTGRLFVDGEAVIEVLEYSSRKNDPAWDRFALKFDYGNLVIRDQRRFGSVELAPKIDALGMDIFDISGTVLREELNVSRRPLKSRLIDQFVVAGLGNLLVDEILWRASLDPMRPSNSLTSTEYRRLLYHLKRVPVELLERGGSHKGDLYAERHEGGRCPRDGMELHILEVGGRTTYYCPEHQIVKGSL